MGCATSLEKHVHTNKIAVSRNSVEAVKTEEEIGSVRGSVATSKVPHESGDSIGTVDAKASKRDCTRDSVKEYEKQASSSSGGEMSVETSSHFMDCTSFSALRKGQELLCRDIFTSKYTQKEMARWREAEIVKVKDNMITVHFVGTYQAVW